MSDIIKSDPSRGQLVKAPNPGLSRRGFEPRNFEEVKLLAYTYVESGMSPFRKISEAIVAIEHGLSLGMSVGQAMASIAVINGRAGIYGDAALALCRGTRELAKHEERFEGSIKDGDAEAICTIVRAQELIDGTFGKYTYEHRFSIDDAKRAGLWGKTSHNGKPTPWVTYPKRMLMMRARGFALRDAFPDILKGIGIAEELQDLPPRRVASDGDIVDAGAYEEAPKSRVEQMADELQKKREPKATRNEDEYDDEPQAEREPEDEDEGADDTDEFVESIIEGLND